MFRLLLLVVVIGALLTEAIPTRAESAASRIIPSFNEPTLTHQARLTLIELRLKQGKSRDAEIEIQRALEWIATDPSGLRRTFFIRDLLDIIPKGSALTDFRPVVAETVEMILSSLRKDPAHITHSTMLSLVSFSDVAVTVGDRALAQRILNEAAVFAPTLTEPQERYLAHGMIAGYAFKHGDQALSMTQEREAMAVIEEAYGAPSSKDKRIAGYVALADFLQQAGAFDSARTFLEKAVAQAEGAGEDTLMGLFTIALAHEILADGGELADVVDLDPFRLQRRSAD